MIRAETVRLIGEEGQMIGIVPIEEARRLAEEAELDLVEISPTATPPVCRLMDFGKYKYQQQKKIQDQKKKHPPELKQLRIRSFMIDPHDVAIKLKKAREFLEEGHRLMITLMFRRREHSYADRGEEVLRERFAKPLEDIAKIESPPSKDGAKMTMVLAPLPHLDRILAKRKAEAEKKAKGEIKNTPSSQPSVTLGSKPEGEGQRREETKEVQPPEEDSKEKGSPPVETEPIIP